MTQKPRKATIPIGTDWYYGCPWKKDGRYQGKKIAHISAEKIDDVDSWVLVFEKEELCTENKRKK